MLSQPSAAEVVRVKDSGPGVATAVQQAVDRYLNTMDGEPVKDLYEMVLCEVEAPLLEYLLNYTESNQSRTALLLGLNRGTLRKKLKKYGLL